MLTKQPFSSVLAGIVALSVASQLLAQPPQARAFPAPSLADADIEKLSGRLLRNGPSWVLDLKFEVEIEDAFNGEQFALVVSLLNDKALLFDPSGQPLEAVIPLDRPVEIDGDEVEFADRLQLPLPEGTFIDPRELRMVGRVVRLVDGAVLDTEHEDVCVDRRFARPEPRIERSLTVIHRRVSSQRVVHRSVRQRSVAGGLHISVRHRSRH